MWDLLWGGSALTSSSRSELLPLVVTALSAWALTARTATGLVCLYLRNKGERTQSFAQWCHLSYLFQFAFVSYLLK